MTVHTISVRIMGSTFGFAIISTAMSNTLKQVTGAIGTCVLCIWRLRSRPSVQGFFSFRIYAFSKKLYLCILIYALAVLRMLDGIASLYVGLQMTSLAGYLEQEEWRATAGWAMGTANDLIVTSTLVVLLHRRRRDASRR